MDNDKLTQYRLAVRQFCDARDWGQFHNPKDMAISLTLEASEVLEHFQWKNEEEVAAFLQSNKGDVAEELADVFYWILRMSDKLDIDLGAAFEQKLAKNNQKYPVEKARGNHKKYTEHAE